MTDFASLLRPDRGGPAHVIHLVDKASFAGLGQAAERGAASAA